MKFTESTDARVVNAVSGVLGALTSAICLRADRVQGSPRYSQMTKGYRWL